MSMEPFSSLPVERQPWEATWWVDVLQRLGQAFPAPDAPEEEWQHFVVRCSAVPVVVLSLGFVMALLLLCSFCCGKRAATPSRRAPSCVPSFCLGLVTIVFVALGGLVYLLICSKALDTAQTQLTRAAGDVRSAASEGSRMEDLGAAMLKNLDSIAPSCPPLVQKQVEAEVQTIRDKVVSFNADIAQLNSLVRPLPGQVDDVKEHAEGIGQLTALALLVPLALVFLSCVLVMVAVMSSCTGRCTGCCLRSLGPLLLAPTVVAVAVAASVQLEVGIVTSSFCKDVDSNSLAYIQKAAGRNSTTYQLSAYYIEGKGTNPLLEDLGLAAQQLDEVNASVEKFGMQVETFCTWKGLASIEDGIAAANQSLETGNQLLSAGNVYPFYDKAVRQDLCRTVVIGLGWLVLFQVAVGLLLLPLLTCVGHGYLKAKRGWHLDSARQALVSIRGGGPLRHQA
eukprot:TRINITY_DN77830_c0_g1_i1.p1 TRINITY_DN77830_c0_g1~~TRINITY_DN77830_c0_g1_i1.p1  ORF type:complete len:460 (-),score=116.12 TRINITY_DN77830_c0_g1_i1:47-1402(-)